MRQFDLVQPTTTSATTTDRPLRALFLTSVRDVGRRSDCNGESVQIDGSLQYIRGVIEASVDGIVAGDRIADHLDVVGVVYDDLPGELRRDGYPVLPQRGDGWIYPLDRRSRDIGGVPLGDLTHHVPSTFRRLPLADLQGRADLKAEFEQRVVDIMRGIEADIVVSDHLLMQLRDLIRGDVHGLMGRVLNIHPAITHADHPRNLRGLTPTQDAIDRANGFRYSRDRQERVAVDPYFRTGATLHFIADEIDAGPVICDDECTPVRPTDEPIALRARNYELAKIPVFLEGLAHYHQRMFDRVASSNSRIVTQS